MGYDSVKKIYVILGLLEIKKVYIAGLILKK